MSASVLPGAISGSDRSPRLADHAATAAVYVTKLEERKRDVREPSPDLQRDGTPPPGLSFASAGAAASAAHARRKPLEFWQPRREPAAERAAYHAKDYLPETEPPQPTQLHSAECFRAASVAVKDHRPVPAAPDQADDRTAAEQVRLSGGRVVQGDVAAGRQRGAYHAASGAFTSSRRRAESAPITPVQRPEATEARHAASVSHRTRPTSEVTLDGLDRSVEASRIHNIAKANVQLYTSKPPVEIEAEEQQRKDTLRAAAVSMARGMYALSRNKDEQGLAGQAVYAAQRGHYRLHQESLAAIGETMAFQRPEHLQEAAQKLASEKLARLQQEHETYRALHGTTASPTRRLSMTARLRRITSSEGDASNIDMQRSKAIRDQMSTLQEQLQRVDEKRRGDHDKLMEVARRNVDAALHDMDEKVYADTGRASLAMLREWEERAHERARLESEGRLALFGKLDVGGAKYVDPVDVEAVARSRIQPTLDEIADRAEEHRAREIERHLDEEERKRRKDIEREREADTRTAQKQAKEEERREAKEQRAALAEKRRQEKQEQGLWRRMSRRARRKEPAPEREETPEAASRYQSAQEGMPTEEAEEADAVASVQAEAVVPPATTQAEVAQVEAASQAEAISQRETSQPEATQPDAHEDVIPGGGEAAANAVASAAVATGAAVEVSPTTSPTGESKIRAWFRERMGRRPSKPSPPSPEAVENGPEIAQRTSSLVGGAVLTGGGEASRNKDRDRDKDKDSARAAALSSHPVTESDLAPLRSDEDEASRHDSHGAEPTTPSIRRRSASTASARETREGQEKSQKEKDQSPTQNNGTSKRARLKKSFMNLITGKSAEGRNGGGQSVSPTSPAEQQGRDSGAAGQTGRPEIRRLTTAEREQLGLGNDVVEPLPQPQRPSHLAGQVSGGQARDSRFSEAL